MNRRIIITGAVGVIAVVSLVAFVIFPNAKATSEPAASPSPALKEASALVDLGRTKDWTGADNTRVGVMVPDQPMSDTDFAWAIQKLNLNKADKNSQIGIVTMTISALVHAKLSTSQVSRLTNAALPLLSMNDPVYDAGDIEQYGCSVFVKYPDARAVPQLHVLLNSPHPWVRRNAARALVTNGENVPIPPRPQTW